MAWAISPAGGPDLMCRRVNIPFHLPHVGEVVLKFRNRGQDLGRVFATLVAMSLVYEAVDLEQPETSWRRLSGNDAEDTLYAVSATGRRHRDRSEEPMLSLKAIDRKS